MSVNVDCRLVPPGRDDYVGEAWNLKEEIRQDEGVLKQRWDFFSDAYRRSTVHAVFDGGDDETLVGFVTVRRDGYVLFLAVHPDARGDGIGRELIRRVAGDNRSVTCHARTTNENALQFYEHLGFEITRRIDNYYEDGGDAYYLKLGDDANLTDKLSGLFRR